MVVLHHQPTISNFNDTIKYAFPFILTQLETTYKPECLNNSINTIIIIKSMGGHTKMLGRNMPYTEDYKLLVVVGQRLIFSINSVSINASTSITWDNCHHLSG